MQGNINKDVRSIYKRIIEKIPIIAVICELANTREVGQPRDQGKQNDFEPAGLRYFFQGAVLPIIVLFIPQSYQQIPSHILENLFVFVSEIFLPFTSLA